MAPSFNLYACSSENMLLETEAWADKSGLLLKGSLEAAAANRRRHRRALVRTLRAGRNSARAIAALRDSVVASMTSLDDA